MDYLKSFFVTLLFIVALITVVSLVGIAIIATKGVCLFVLPFIMVWGFIHTEFF